MENLFKKKPLQDLLSRLNDVISTNAFITGHVIYNPAYTYKFQLKTTLHLKPSPFKFLQAYDTKTKFQLSTNHRTADQLKVQCCDLGERNVEGRNFIVLSYARTPVLTKKFRWSRLKENYSICSKYLLYCLYYKTWSFKAYRIWNWDSWSTDCLIAPLSKKNKKQ